MLIQCIQVLTKPTRERRQLFSQHDLLDSTGTMKGKSLKQLYCLSTILFCTNNQCNMPLQYLLSDAILCLGGSTELVKILNRIGAVASLDTHNRVATCAVARRIANGIRAELTPQTFTVLSIDNIDILQRHAMVSSTESKRSWHGTSVQCVQPMPESITIPIQEMHSACQVLCVHDQDTVEHVRSASQLRKKHSESSPTMSPALKQVEKRRRTLREHFSPHSQTQVAGGKEIPPDMFANMHDYLAYEIPRIAQFTIRSFQVFPEEESCLAQLRQAILQYMIIKEVKSIDLYRVAWTYIFPECNAV